jgi:acyl-CoA thioester hydrolase
MKAELINITETRVRFSEIDSMAVVWHGNYLKYLEDGRESFGRQYELGYYDVFDYGFTIPVVKLDISYTQHTRYNDSLIIETQFVNSEAAKIIFDYKIYRKSDNALVVKARSIQVFVNSSGELQLTNPEFFIDWKKKFNII